METQHLMPLQFLSYITNQDLTTAHHARQNILFVFGDNLARWGEAGQAKEMRGEPNAVGLPTKRAWNQYLCDADLPALRVVTSADITRLHRCLDSRGVVVWPANGIGTGFAKLEEKAPLIHQFYAELLAELVANYGRI